MTQQDGSKGLLPLAGVNVGFDAHYTYFDELELFRAFLGRRHPSTVIRLEELRREILVERGIITKKDYNIAQALLYEETFFFNHVRSFPGAATSVLELHRLGAVQTIITASGPRALKCIQTSAEHHGELYPHVNIVSCGRNGTKTQAAIDANIHFFLDNKLKHLQEVRYVVPRPCFFVRPNNRHEIKAARRFATLIESWPEYFDYIVSEAPRVLEEQRTAESGSIVRTTGRRTNIRQNSSIRAKADPKNEQSFEENERPSQAGSK